jgi:endo-alpha-1,4-polygalactosaminidase (GH114 family)
VQTPTRHCLRVAAFLLLGAASSVAGAGGVRHTRPLSIHEVQSFDYFIAPGLNGVPRGGQQFRAAVTEAYDMLIANYYSGRKLIEGETVREFQDSSPRGRLAIAYINVGEFMRCCSSIDLADQEQWFDANGELTAGAPQWLGPRNPKFKNLWSAREWDPHWQAYILGEIDKIVALGFDGVFLDMLYSDGTWGPSGFAAGLAGVADYRELQKNFAKAIWRHIRDDLKDSGFIIVTNYSGVWEDNGPATTEGVEYSDAFLKESEYFGRDDKPAPWIRGKSIQQYSASRYARFYAPMLRRGKVVLIQEYNLSFDSQALVLKECAHYGYLASNTNFPQNLIHIDGLPICTSRMCSATTVAGRTVSFQQHQPLMP